MKDFFLFMVGVCTGAVFEMLTLKDYNYLIIMIFTGIFWYFVYQAEKKSKF